MLLKKGFTMGMPGRVIIRVLISSQESCQQASLFHLLHELAPFLCSLDELARVLPVSSVISLT